jgi:hypothetical protein
MSAYFGEEMGRHLATSPLRQCSGTHPARHAADPLRIRHYIIARTGRQCPRHLFRAHEVLPELDRGGKGVSDPRIALEIVGLGRLLDPYQAAFLIEHSTAQDRFRHGERLIEVAHQLDLRSDRPFDDANSLDIFVRAIASKP